MALSRLTKLFKLTYNFIFKTKKRALTVKVVLLSSAARLRIYLYSGNKLYQYFGHEGEETSVDNLSPDKKKKAILVSAKVSRVAKRVPWESKCLVQAMVAQRLLRGYGIASTMYLGVGRDKDNHNKMIAHAWVRSGPYYICGGNGEGYAVVAKFSY